jgi:hypothetical protein
MVQGVADCASSCNASASTCAGFNFIVQNNPDVPIAFNCLYDVDSGVALSYGVVDGSPSEAFSICYTRGYLYAEGEPKIRYLSPPPPVPPPPPPPLPPAVPADADWATTCGTRAAHYLGGGDTFVDTGVAPTLWTATAPAGLPYVRVEQRLAHMMHHVTRNSARAAAAEYGVLVFSYCLHSFVRAGEWVLQLRRQHHHELRVHCRVQLQRPGFVVHTAGPYHRGVDAPHSMRVQVRNVFVAALHHARPSPCSLPATAAPATQVSNATLLRLPRT